MFTLHCIAHSLYVHVIIHIFMMNLRNQDTSIFRTVKCGPEGVLIMEVPLYPARHFDQNVDELPPVARSSEWTRLFLLDSLIQPLVIYRNVNPRVS